MKVELRNVSFNPRLSEETNCFAADIYVDDVKVGTAANRGTGGPTNVHLASNVRAVIEAFCAAMPPLQLGHGLGPIPMTSEHYIDQLLEEHLATAQLKRWCKAGTVLKLKEHGQGEFVRMKEKYSTALGVQLRQEYGDRLEYIVNERLLYDRPLGEPG